MKKRAAFLGDIPVFTIALFVMAIVLVTLYYTTTKINDGWQDANIPTVSKNMFGNFKDKFVGVYDNFYLLLVIGYFIVILILGYFLRSMPMFAFLAVFLLIIFGMVAVYLSNAYFDFASTSEIVDYATEFTMLNYLAQHLPHIVIIFGFLFIIILYAKSRSSGTI